MTSKITTLVNNTAGENLDFEHGLSFWIEFHGSHILFDTGQTEVIKSNAENLGINFADTDAVILSHGHYDHTGGIPCVFEKARQAKLYLHPEAIASKFSLKNGKSRMIGMPEPAKAIIKTLERKEKLVWTDKPMEIIPGFFVTGPIPRKTGFENTGGDFYVDLQCLKIDRVPDDQAAYFKTEKGLVVLLGCAHSGVVNTLDYILSLTEEKKIYAILGGMHLLNRSGNRIRQTIQALRKYNIAKLGPAHCTESNSIQKIRETFPDKYFGCKAGNKFFI